jgi:site-specific recombinase XerD
MNKPRVHQGVEEWPPGSGRYRIDYYDAEGKRHREMVGGEKLAIRVYQQRRTEIWEGRFLPKKKSAATFREISEKRMKLAKPRLSTRSYKTDRDRLDRILEKFGELPAEKVSSSRIQEFLADVVGAGATRSTANRYRSLLSSIFHFAITSGELEKNPIRRVARFREPKGRRRFLDRAEEGVLRTAIGAASEARLWEFDIALHTGMRRGEQWGLRWADVDLDNFIAAVDGKSGQRHVRLNAAAREALVRLHKLSNGSPFVSPDKKRSEQQDFRRWFEDACETAKIDDVTWHTLRHTFCSRLAMAGVDLVTIKNLAGHSSIQTTMRYAHLSPGHEEAAVEKLDTFMDTPRRKRSAEGQQVLQFKATGQ